MNVDDIIANYKDGQLEIYTEGAQDRKGQIAAIHAAGGWLLVHMMWIAANTSKGWKYIFSGNHVYHFPIHKCTVIRAIPTVVKLHIPPQTDIRFLAKGVDELKPETILQ